MPYHQIDALPLGGWRRDRVQHLTFSGNRAMQSTLIALAQTLTIVTSLDKSRSPQRQWQPQQVRADILTRVAVLPTEIAWHPTDLPGIWFGCFESDPAVQEHPVTMLTQFEPGSFFPVHDHPGGEEILVLQGSFADEAGVYPPGTYMLNPEGFIHCPHSLESCLTFVKLRQHGGENRHQVKTNIYQAPWKSGIIPQIEIQHLYQQSGFPERIWIERWQPGTALPQAIESEVKEIFVIAGTWIDELGDYPAGSWLRYPPHHAYNPSSEIGCTIYVKTYPSDVPRFIVGKDWEIEV
jgi:anti-sigma factor ChrR (cupin superfamily)